MAAELSVSGIRSVAAEAHAPAAPPSASGLVGTRQALRRRLTRGVGVLSVMSVAAGVVNYGSNIAFARVLSVSRYGDLTSLLSLFVVISVPLAAAQTRVAERTAAHVAAGELGHLQGLVRHAEAHMAMLGLVGTALYCALIPVIADALSLTNATSAGLLAAMIFFAFLFPALQGVLQGLERWVAFGAIGLALGVGRLAFGIPLALLTRSAGGAIAGQALGMLVVLTAVIWLVRDHLHRGERGVARAGLRRRPDLRAVSAGAAYVLFAVIANTDVLFAKFWMSPKEAGRYAALSTIGKVVTYLPAAVAVVVVPSVAAVSNDLERRRRVLQGAALLVGAISLLAIIPAAIAPHLLVTMMFGSSYAPIAAGVLPIVIAGGGLAMLYLIVTFSVAIGDRRWALLLAFGVVVQVTGIGLFHANVTQVAAAQATMVVVLLLINEFCFHALILRRRHG